MTAMPSLRALPSIALRPLRTPSGFVRLCLTALFLIWLIIPSGGMVRLTSSGLGCPDWPLCDGGVVPASAGHQLIEYSNRLVSGIVLIIAVLTWVVGRGVPGLPAGTRRWAAAVGITTFAQMPLGGVTVLSGLHPLAVGSHFLLSIVALACVTILTLRVLDWRAGRERSWDRRRGVLAGIVAAACAVVVTSGVVVTAAGPHSGDDDVTKRFGDLPDAVTVHVRMAIGFTLLAIVLVAWVWRERGLDRLTGTLAAVAVPLIALQITLGEYQYRHGLPWGVVALHVSVSGAVWAVVLAACWGIARPVTATYGRREATLWQGTQRTESGSALSRPSGISAPQSTQIP